MCACIWKPDASIVYLLQQLPTLFSETGSLNLKLSMGWLTSKPKGSACLGHTSGLAQRPLRTLAAPAFYMVREFQAKVLGFQSRHGAFPPVPPHQVFFGRGECFLSSFSFLRDHTASALQLCCSKRDAFTSYRFYVILDSSRGPTPSPFSLKGVLELFFCYQRVRRISLFRPRKRLHLDLRVYLKSHFHP